MRLLSSSWTWTPGTGSYARNLAPFTDQIGKPTAGIHFDIPDHLSGIHKTLLQFGHSLWLKFNKDPGFKRNVRYDDAEKTFCMDVKFPNRNEWITVDHARALMDKRKKAASLDIEDLLSTGGASADHSPLPIVEAMEGLPDASGTSGATGSVTETSWRCPTQK